MKITQKLKLEPWHHGYYNTRKGLNGGKRMSVLYEKLEACYKYYQSVTDFVPRVGLILGSGLGGYAKNMKVEKEIPYGDIPGFPVSTVQGHDGKFLLGYIGEVPAVVMKGRVHYYEGYSMQDVVLPTRLMKRMGIEILFLTNASGGIKKGFQVGDFMMITDQISSFVPSPLIGENVSELGERFPDMTHIYDPDLMNLIRKTAESRAELRRGLALPEELKLLLFVGRLEAYKRPFAALELLERLGGQYGLVVIGDGSLSERFQETAAEKGLLDRFFYFRRVPNVEMYRYYAACDYFVNFNTHEIFGMSILEAMYQGCVVAARRAPGPEQIIEDGVSGFLCSSDQEMDQVFSDPRTERMGEAAEKRIQDCFTWDRTAEQIRAQVLKQLTGRQRAEEGKE